MERNNGIDLFRFIGALFIIFLHTNYGRLDKDYVEIIRLSARWGVPFFFMVSGYFLGKKLGDNNVINFNIIEKNVVNLITIFLVSNIIYFPIELYYNGPRYDLKILFSGYFYHLWFIGALIFGFISLWYLSNRGLFKILPFLSVIILLYGIFSDAYDCFFSLKISFELGRTLLVVPFMYLGIVLSKIDFKPKYIPFLFAIAVFGFVLECMEANMFLQLFKYKRYAHEVLIGTLVFSISMFILAASIKIPENIWSLMGAKYSLFIYLYHPFVIKLILDKNIEYTFPNATGEFLLKIKPLLAFLITLLLAALLDKLLNPVFSVLTGNFKNLKEGFKRNSLTNLLGLGKR